MTIHLKELTANQVVGLNRSVIKHANQKLGVQEIHQVRNLGGLQSCLGAIFYQSQNGYAHLPIEKMAGLMLYRIAQGQYFLQGNKRTATLACVAFLSNNGHRFRIEKDGLDYLLWNFAPPPDDPDLEPEFDEDDAIKYIFENILPRN